MGIICCRDDGMDDMESYDPLISTRVNVVTKYHKCTTCDNIFICLNPMGHPHSCFIMVGDQNMGNSTCFSCLINKS